MFVVAVKDRATDQFLPPQFFVAPGQAIRTFTDVVNNADKENQLYLHPDDFDMYEFGWFVTDDGTFDVSVGKVLVRGKDVAIREVN